MRRRSVPATALALILAIALAGCGGSDDEDSTPAPADGGGGASEKAPNQVEMRNIQFEPAQITVKAGDTITWVNKEEIEHNVVATKGASFKSETFGLDGTFEFEPSAAGTISYVCTIHPGMDGKVTVQ